MALPPTNNTRQRADNALVDQNGKQAMLGNHFSINVPTTSIAATTETPLLYISNPSTNAAVPLSSATQPAANTIFINLRKFLCLTSGQNVLINFYLNPASAPTGGSSLTPTNRRTASATTSIATVTLSPTWTVTGTPIENMFATNSIPDSTQQMLILDPGQSLVVTATCSANPTKVAGNVSEYEI